MKDANVIPYKSCIFSIFNLTIFCFSIMQHNNIRNTDFLQTKRNFSVVLYLGGQYHYTIALMKQRKHSNPVFFQRNVTCVLRLI
jgi:hypothetical protein